MGLQKITVTTCDGPGCDMHHEMNESVRESWMAGPCTFMREMSLTLANKTLWEGVLCDACETRFRDALTAAIPRTAS